MMTIRLLAAALGSLALGACAALPAKELPAHDPARVTAQTGEPLKVTDALQPSPEEGEPEPVTRGPAESPPAQSRHHNH